MTGRPQPHDPAPAGYHYEVVAARWLNWEVITPHGPFDGRTCRIPRCENAAIAVLWRRAGSGQRAWCYCGEHLYGGWIEDGQVVGWRLVKDET